jgi:hypothetical protein
MPATVYALPSSTLMGLPIGAVWRFWDFVGCITLRPLVLSYFAGSRQAIERWHL